MVNNYNRVLKTIKSGLNMPVEIRELVIQAKLMDPDNATQQTIKPGPSESNTDNASQNDEDDCECAEKGPVWENSLMERCLARVKEWLYEQNHR